MLELKLNARRGGFSLQVECSFASGWTVIFGHSGAGKSTLLRLLSGLDKDAQSKPAQVRVVLDGNVLTDTANGTWIAPGQRSTALVSQQPSLFPHLSVEANVAYGLHAMERRSRAKRVAEVLELAGATDLTDRRPRDLSGGQAQRVALARALAPAPRLLLLDEPFSALDGTASDALVDRLQVWLRANNVQTVIATHDATDAFATSADVALLNEGRLAALGSAEDVLKEERERIVHRLGPS